MGDGANFRKSLSLLLKRKNYSVLETENRREALKLINTNPLDGLLAEGKT